MATTVKAVLGSVAACGVLVLAGCGGGGEAPSRVGGRSRRAHLRPVRSASVLAVA